MDFSLDLPSSHLNVELEWRKLLTDWPSTSLGSAPAFSKKRLFCQKIVFTQASTGVEGHSSVMLVALLLVAKGKKISPSLGILNDFL